jgi:hypothetical protein
MTSTNKEVDASSALAYSDDGEPVCYLCLDGGLLEQLRRDCACRGTDAGFVHLACLADYAETKSKQANGMIKFRKPWRDCPGCHQKYQNELRIDIAAEFVLFVRRQYPSDTQRQVESLSLKLHALIDIIGRLTAKQKREAGVTANVILSLIDRMRVVAPLTRRYSQMEAYAYNVHGQIALEEGTEESARRAVVHFETSLQVFESIGDYDGIAAVKGNIAIAKSYEGGNYKEELLRASQELYELRIAEHGDEHYYTILAGKYYALRLQKSNRREEAREQLMKLLATSKQVFGSDHNITKSVEAML